MDSFFNIKTQKPPENWVELIQGKEWRLVAFITMNKNKVEHILRDQDTSDHFRFDSVRISIGSSGTIKDSVSYFPKNNSFYWRREFVIVIDVTDQFLTLEYIPQSFRYDSSTGKMLKRKVLRKYFDQRKEKVESKQKDRIFGDSTPTCMKDLRKRQIIVFKKSQH